MGHGFCVNPCVWVMFRVNPCVGLVLCENQDHGGLRFVCCDCEACLVWVVPWVDIFGEGCGFMPWVVDMGL
uniref:Uncharacterized protein n=1 Tax=Fagus sylvatica TaxID=28930 RepID=A0A2N9IFZ4_FAGSY